MILIIDTTDNEIIKLALENNKKIIDKKKIKARRKQSEKLLPGIDKLLKDNNLTWRSIKKIEVANRGGSFTSLRIGVATANALAYALGVKAESLDAEETSRERIRKNKISIVAAEYDRDPDIKLKNSP